MCAYGIIFHIHSHFHSYSVELQPWWRWQHNFHSLILAKILTKRHVLHKKTYLILDWKNSQRLTNTNATHVIKCTIVNLVWNTMRKSTKALNVKSFLYVAFVKRHSPQVPRWSYIQCSIMGKTQSIAAYVMLNSHNPVILVNTWMCTETKACIHVYFVTNHFPQKVH